MADETSQDTIIKHGQFDLESSDPMADRRRNVYHMKLRGYKNKDIARILGLTSSQVQGDLKHRKSEIRDVTDHLDSLSYAAEIREDFEQLRAEAWNEYDKAPRPSDRARYLNLIARLRKDELDALQGLGALDRRTVQHELDINIQGALSVNIDDERLDAIALALLSNQMGSDPQTTLAQRGRAATYIDAVEKKTVPQQLAATGITEMLDLPPTEQDTSKKPNGS